VVPRGKIEQYIDEADCVLIGPGLPRAEGQEEGDDDTKELTERLLRAYPNKKWVIDGGSLQVIEPSIVPKNAILTPHMREFEKLFKDVIATQSEAKGKQSQEIAEPVPSEIASASSSLRNDERGISAPRDDVVLEIAKKHNCIILLKGQVDIVCSPTDCVEVKGGNPGMTKGGTGDVLAGLVAALYCKNDAFLAAAAGSYINKKAGDALFEKVGPYFNTSDLASEIPKVMAELLF
jgi:NAD(P)H-hydrate epimerase